MSSPIEQLRSIVANHESEHGELYDELLEDVCDCMERIDFILQVFYPEGVSELFEDMSLAEYADREGL